MTKTTRRTVSQSTPLSSLIRLRASRSPFEHHGAELPPPLYAVRTKQTVGDERRVVVIGSGPAGAVAARELIRNGIPVTMLEAGEGFVGGLLLRFAGMNMYRRGPSLGERAGHVVSGDPRTKCYGGFIPGGLSNFWTGAVPRFAPEDFNEGARLHERYRWPICYSDLADMMCRNCQPAILPIEVRYHKTGLRWNGRQWGMAKVSR
jgi:predicted NAD/FAD-dependent oxidoreductase